MVRVPGRMRAVIASKKISRGSQKVFKDQEDRSLEKGTAGVFTERTAPLGDYKAGARPRTWISDIIFVISRTIGKRMLPLLAALLLAAAVKAVLFVFRVIPFNSDEAVVALMARHILQGERPIFFYGQAYMGSLDAWLVAAAFRILGESVQSLRLVQAVLYLLYLVTVWLIGRSLFRDHRVAPVAVLLGAVPTVLVTTYTSASLGGYGETLVLGNLVLWLCCKIAWGGWSNHRAAWLVLGLIGGVAFWTLGMSLVYLLPAAVILAWRFRFTAPWNYTLALAGFIVGSSPWWLANLNSGWAPLSVLLNAGADRTSPLEHVVGFIIFGLPALIGVRFPWLPGYAPPVVMFLLLLFNLGAISYLILSVRRNTSYLLKGPGALFITFVLGYILIFVFTHFGIDATGRYLLPLNLMVIFTGAALIAFVWRRKRTWGVFLLGLVLVLNALETGRAALATDRITTQFDPATRFDNTYDAALIDFLRDTGESRGYTNYWVSFRLAFLSEEELIFAPLLPYKRDILYANSDNRYPDYVEAVARSSRTAFITVKQPDLDDLLRQKLQEQGVAFDEQQIGIYRVFYNLSKPTHPQELDLKGASS